MLLLLNKSIKQNVIIIIVIIIIVIWGLLLLNKSIKQNKEYYDCTIYIFKRYVIEYLIIITIKL